MRNNLTNFGGQANQAPFPMNQEANKPTRNRRALGDITNAGASETQSDTKKATTSRDENRVQSTVAMRDTSADSRSYMNRPIDDIDSKDANNPALTSIYVVEMYQHFREQELAYKIDCEYMNHRQSYINERMRCILVDWLVEVHLKFKMVPETLYLTIHIIDRYLAMKEVRRSRLQLVGVAALLIASKYEEIYSPEIKDLVYITDRAYEKAEILQMENEIIVSLNYDITVPTIHSFLCRWLKAAHADRSIVQMSCYLCERMLQEYSMLQFLPSVIAATAVMLARKALQRFPWSSTLLHFIGYDESDLAECAREMEKFVNDQSSQQTAVKRKYSTSRFGSVAGIPLV